MTFVLLGTAAQNSKMLLTFLICCPLSHLSESYHSYCCCHIHCPYGTVL